MSEAKRKQKGKVATTGKVASVKHPFATEGRGLCPLLNKECIGGTCAWYRKSRHMCGVIER